MLTLYFSPGSSSMATHIALHEIGVPFESRSLSFSQREHQSPAFLAINPEGKVPTLLIDGRVLTEVAAILFIWRGVFPKRGSAGRRHRGRGAGDLVDVLYRRDHPPGAADRHRALEGSLRHRRPAAGRPRMGARGAIRLPTSISSGSTGASRPRLRRHRANIRASTRTSHGSWRARRSKRRSRSRAPSATTCRSGAT